MLLSKISLGDFLFMLGTGPVHFSPGTHINPDSGYRSRYNHDKEQVEPNYWITVSRPE